MSLTVIVPVFHSASLVAQFRDVILAQSDRPEAVVFVDDGSRDGTAAELCRAAETLKRAGIGCTIVTHAENRGRGAARRSGLDAVKTEHAAWLDIDDLFGPDRIRRLRHALAKADTARGPWLLTTPYTLCQARRISARTPMPARAVASVADLYDTARGPRTLQLQTLAGPTASFQLAGFDPALNWAEDLDFLLRFLGAGGHVQTADPADPAAPQAEDVIYFQSFTRTGRDLVEEANRRVYDKNSALLLSHGIAPEAELARKTEAYIAHFAPHSAPQTEEAPSEALDLPDAADGAYLFLSPMDDVVARLAAGQVPSRADIVGAFLAGADRLRRIRSAADPYEVEDRRILRSPTGRFDLQDAGRMHAAQQGGPLSSWADGAAPAGVFQPIFARLTDPSLPLFISFFAGAPFYRACAERLSRQLERFGVDYQICEFTPDAGIDWTRICRKKIAYQIAQHRRHGRPIFWIDADSQLVGDPRALGTGNDDGIGAFLRNFHYLMGFDPAQFARLLHPGYLRFGMGTVIDRFFAHLESVDAAAPDNATDDWVLQEALSSFDGALTFTLFPPAAVTTTQEAESSGAAVFQHTDSGNVANAARTAAQHLSEALSPERQLPVLRDGAQTAMKRGELRDAASFYKRIRQIAPGDTEALTRLLNVYDRLGEAKKYAFHFNRAKKDPALRGAALRADLDRLYGAGLWEDAEKTGATLIATGTPEDAAFAQSRAYRHGFDRRAAARGIPDEDRVPMMWWEQPFPGNLGDIIGPYVVEGMTGIPPRYSKASPRVLSIGSIIRFGRAGDTIWGSGAAAQLQELDPRAQYRAVRGPLTRDMVLKAGAACPEVYGDPAWFLPHIHPCRDVAKTHRLGLIRHFTHETRALDIAPDVRSIGIIRGSVAEIEAFLEEMNACEAIISTSLHGLIIAQAYGIPAAWAVDSASGRQIHGDGMKFADYALSVGMPEPVPFDLASVPRIDAALAALCTHAPTRPFDLKRLADAAPFTVTPDFRARL
ncbi:glycosyltransferase [Falsirhodobacter algicola]|uniref:Glycosyltransferase n=1 Tax=Falsirhodobacter algicola TaxID=2692330 RepID=A0A8J8SLE6_9RHOB|nr:glycosyltransferase [Falsirhodobacter algicola]QUS36329.1 glycosyltransferase [Falsirhodobacter algicola]